MHQLMNILQGTMEVLAEAILYHGVISYQRSNINCSLNKLFHFDFAFTVNGPIQALAAVTFF